jgi:ERCC4-related helicase
MKSPKIQSRLYAGGSQVRHEPGPVGRPAMQSRAYQLEMFEETLKRNTIICMSTGSGKTQIAKLRIEAELKRSPTKIVWFMAPSVALSQQQHSYLSRQLPAHQFRIITSLDNVDHWSTQAIWDAALWNMEVIVSTPQPLLDALSHGFVHMRRISLLVFDEAHHCTKNAPMNKILQTFYHPAKQEGLVSELPHILGLSASPITSSRSTLESLERNMDAVCTTPTRQIDEYRQFVHEPEFVALPFMPPDKGSPPLVLSRLRQTIDSLDINDDPYVRFLRKNGSKKSQERLGEVLENRGTSSFKQLQALDRRANDLYCELGESACTRFIVECTTRLHGSEANTNRLLLTLANQEWKHLDAVLTQTRLDAVSLLECKRSPDQISAKAAVLFKLLVKEFTSGMRCVIFVKQRSTAWALSQLINLHPEFRGKYSAEPFVGLTRLDRNVQLVDLVKMRNPSEVLANFESGKVNIVVATSVMEEGVDIPATNIVIRFDDSENFRSFVQSRGRARHPHSKFVTLLEGGYDERPYKSWKALEIEMKAKYADEHRKMADMEEEEEEDLKKSFRVPSTGYVLRS